MSTNPSSPTYEAPSGLIAAQLLLQRLLEAALEHHQVSPSANGRWVFFVGSKKLRQRPREKLNKGMSSSFLQTPDGLVTYQTC